MEDEEAQENKLVIRQVYYDLINKKKYQLIDKFFSPEFHLRINGELSKGRASLLAFLKTFDINIPNQHFEIMSIFGEGDMVCAQWKLIVKLDFGSRIVSTTGITIFKFRAGKIELVDQHWDIARIQKEVGAEEIC